jgi:hypothetical protein
VEKVLDAVADIVWRVEHLEKIGCEYLMPEQADFLEDFARRLNSLTKERWCGEFVRITMGR